MLRVQHTPYNKCTVIGILMNDLQSLNITASVSVFRLTHSLSVANVARREPLTPGSLFILEA